MGHVAEGGHLSQGRRVTLRLTDAVTCPTRRSAVAFSIACLLVGCGTQWWVLVPIADDSGSPLIEASVDVASGVQPDAINPLIHFCANDIDCEMYSQQCDVFESPQICVPCVDDSHCTQPYLHRCSPFRQCVECVLSAHCSAGQQCQGNRCIYPCADSTDCPMVLPKCNPIRLICVSCLTNNDCMAAGTVCDVTTGHCTEGTPSTTGARANDGGTDLVDAAVEDATWDALSPLDGGLEGG